MTILTSDNPHLSEVSAPTAVGKDDTGFAVNCKRIEEEGAGTDVSETVRLLLLAGTSANTRRAYRADLAHFLAKGGAVPASSNLVTSYLARHAGQLAIATLARRLVAVGRAHTSLELKPLPN
jgi:hypothetical protein